MRRGAFISIAAAAILLLCQAHAGAQAVPGYSLVLTATPLGSGGMGDLIRPGTVIAYTISHTEPPPANVTYQFITPIGTTFLSAQALTGARTTVETSFPTPTSVGPVGQADVRVLVEPRAVQGTVSVKVRVNDIWQGMVTAQADFLATGIGGSNVIAGEVSLGDGVPGQLVASAFVDLNGNGLVDFGDVAENCQVYVYTDLTGKRVPDDLADPADPRLPLVALALTDQTGTALINLLPGRYAVHFAACAVPASPSGAPLTAVDQVARPPVTHISTQSGASSYDVQIVDVASTRSVDVIFAERPIGAVAAPTDLRFDGLTLIWVDNAQGETGYQVVIQSETFVLPPNSTRFVVSARFSVPCGYTDLQLKVAARIGDAAGYPASASLRSIGDCAAPEAVTAPDAGSGPGRGQPGDVPAWALLTTCTGLAGAGLMLVGNRRLSHNKRGDERS